jgi:hypothetical protein
VGDGANPPVVTVPWLHHAVPTYAPSMGRCALLLPVAKKATEVAAPPAWAVTHEVVGVLEVTLGTMMYCLSL